MKICVEDRCPNPQPCAIHKPKRSASSRLTSSPGWKRIRHEVLVRDHYTCQICEDFANTVDHIRPAATAGTNDKDNLRAVCAACNRSKGAD